MPARLSPPAAGRDALAAGRHHYVGGKTTPVTSFVPGEAIPDPPVNAPHPGTDIRTLPRRLNTPALWRWHSRRGDVDDGDREPGTIAAFARGGVFFSILDESLEAGVFGSPFFIVDGESFSGLEKMELMEEWLATGGWQIRG